MSEERFYRGATIRRRHRHRQPHGWWLIPDRVLRDHPDRGWVMTLEDAVLADFLEPQVLRLHPVAVGARRAHGDVAVDVVAVPVRTEDAAGQREVALPL